jgi:hypothetical protein
VCFPHRRRTVWGAAKEEGKVAKRSNAERVMLIAMPDMGLSAKAKATLKRQFTNSVIEALGGKEKLAGRDIVITMIPAEPIPWFQIRKK